MNESIDTLEGVKKLVTDYTELIGFIPNSCSLDLSSIELEQLKRQTIYFNSCRSSGFYDIDTFAYNSY